MIIDVLNLFFACDENKSREMTQRLMMLAKIRKRRPGSTILLLHHLRKTSGEQHRVQLRKDPALWMEYARGSSALLAHVDLAYGLEHETSAPNEPGVFVFTGIVRSFAPPLLVLKRDPSSLLYQLASPAEAEERIFTPAQKKLWEKLSAKFTFNNAVKELGCHKKLLAAVVKKAREQGLLEKYGNMYHNNAAPPGQGNSETPRAEPADRAQDSGDGETETTEKPNGNQ